MDHRMELFLKTKCLHWTKFNKICRSLMQYIDLPLNTIISLIVFIMPHEAWKENRKLEWIRKGFECCGGFLSILLGGGGGGERGARKGRETLRTWSVASRCFKSFYIWIPLEISGIQQHRNHALKVWRSKSFLCKYLTIVDRRRIEKFTSPEPINFLSITAQLLSNFVINSFCSETHSVIIVLV